MCQRCAYALSWRRLTLWLGRACACVRQVAGAMGLTATLAGALGGSTIVLFTRSFRKAPYFTSARAGTTAHAAPERR